MNYIPLVSNENTFLRSQDARLERRNSQKRGDDDDDDDNKNQNNTNLQFVPSTAINQRGCWHWINNSTFNMRDAL